MDISTMLATGQTSFLVLFGISVLIGALHGLEPGHSKTMMAAFIIAIKGTLAQAVVLGVAAALSHSIVVWILAALALNFGNALIGEQLEPWLMTISGGIVVLMAFWMAWQLRKASKTHHHDPVHDHIHDHHDAHAAAHARQIQRQFVNGSATWTQTILFGLTGGFIPCSAAISVLLMCLNLDQFWLGMSLVAGFSFGLALTLVIIGSIAALGLQVLRSRNGIVDQLFTSAPYVSAIIVGLAGCFMIWYGLMHLTGHA